MTAFRKLLLTTAAAASVAALGLPVTASAQTTIEEVVVTAQRRQESVQSIPVAVSAFSPKQLENLNITNALGVAQYVPNLFAMNNTGLGSANAYYLRALGNTESIATFDPPVGTYIDDIYISRQNANNFALFDMDRIEVLRGPQGTLFGRNTTGGAVNLLLKKPGDTMTGFVEAAYGSYNKWEGRGSIDLPLSETVRSKLSAYGVRRDGYAKNVTTGEKVNDQDGWGIRGALSIDITSNLKWDGAIAHVVDDSVNLLNFTCNPVNPAQCGDRYVSTGLARTLRTPTGTFVNAAGNALGVSGRKAGYGLGNEVVTTLYTSNLEWKVNNNLTVNAITGFVDLRQQFAVDFFDGRANAPGWTFAGTPPVATISPAQLSPVVRGFVNGGFTITNDGRHRQFTQEVKASGDLADGKLKYVAGIFYINENNKTDFADIFTLAVVPGNIGSPLILADRYLTNTAKATAGYVQLDYAFTDQLTATAGVRYTDEKKSFELRDNRATCFNQAAAGCLSTVNIAAATFPSGARIPLSQSTKLWTPRFVLNYKPMDDLLLFASATNGFKSGGWNARGTAVASLLPFTPEKVWSYEAGAKTEWLENRLRVNATLFQQETKDFQVPSAFVNPATGAISFITRNFADMENKGVELEVQALPVEGLTLFANAGFQDAKYKIKRGGPTFDAYNILSVSAQQAECRAALAGQPSPIVNNTAAAATRAQTYCGAGIVDPSGNISKPVRAPDVTLSTGFTYEALTSIGYFIPSATATYYDDSEVGTSNASIYVGPTGVGNVTGGTFVNGSKSSSVWLVNASLAWENADRKYRVSVDCNNCFDETYVQSTLSNFTYLNPPRMWTLRAKAKF